MSQMAMTLGGLVLLGMFTAEFFLPKQRPTNRSVRIVFYFAAVVLYFLSVSGVACVNMESMLRYEFSLHPLNRTGAFALFAQSSLPLVAGPGNRGDCNRGDRRGRAGPGELVHLEFYARKLGCLN